MTHSGQDFEIAISTRAFRMHHALRNPLAIEVREFPDQRIVLNQNWSSRACGARDLIVGDRGAALGREGFLRVHQPFVPSIAAMLKAGKMGAQLKSGEKSNAVDFSPPSACIITKS